LSIRNENFSRIFGGNYVIFSYNPSHLFALGAVFSLTRENGESGNW